MSQISSRLDPDLRAVMLCEVRGLLPAFLSSASVERGGPIRAAEELLGLSRSDLARVLAVHMVLSDPVGELTQALAVGMQRPVTASIRPRVATRSVTSGIDWSATIRHRATSSPLGDVWVTRPAQRVFDIPENRALAWLLRTIDERAAVAMAGAGPAKSAWLDTIGRASAAVRKARRVAWLEGISDEWPGDEAYRRLSADRTGFYQGSVAAAAKYLRRLVVAPAAEDIVDALSQRYFEPTEDWKLFEIAVLLRIARSLSQVGVATSPTRLFQGRGSRPFASYKLSSTRTVRVWYQSWPRSTCPSELDDAVRHYELRPSGSRPDIVIEVLEGGEAIRAFVLELKASSSGQYLASGFSQLLGYLRERPALLSQPGAGWLVAPCSSSFVSKPHDGRALWATSADEVASAVVDAVRT